MPSAPAFFARLYRYRSGIMALAVGQLRRTYAGTASGTAWAFLHPLLTIAVFWFVFSVGFRLRGDQELPFIVSFLPAYCAWLFFQTTISQAASSVIANSHLAVGSQFPTEFLPVASLLANLLVHGAIIVAVLAFLLLSGVLPSVWILQLAYYQAGLIVLTLGLSWLVAALNVYFRDLGEAIPILLNIWFWITPIVWPISILPDGVAAWLRFNPAYYFIDGYRRSLISGSGFWDEPDMGVVFWIVALLTLALGAWVFRRLKNDFADVL